MHTVNEAKIKKTLKAAINVGSRILLKSYKKNDFKVELKSAKEWVTETDVAVEKSIIKEILKFYPESNFLAEESGTNIKKKENITGNTPSVLVISKRISPPPKSTPPANANQSPAF